MNPFRLTILLILLLVVAVTIWRLQKFRIPKLINRWVLFTFLILLFIYSWISSSIVKHEDKIIIVSQSYHATRAVYIASKKGIDAIGFFSGDVRITPPREYISRIKAVFFQ